MIKHKNMLIIICGGTGSGKTTIASEISNEVNEKYTTQQISLDWFYIGDVSKMPTVNNMINFDHPDGFDWKLLKSCLIELLDGRSTKVPQYDYAKQKRIDEWIEIKPADIIILEGLLALHDKVINEMGYFKIYVDAPDDVRLLRVIKRDLIERGKTLEYVTKQWLNHISPMHNLYVAKQKGLADMIVPWTTLNDLTLSALKKLIFNLR